ncbi:MAG: YIP1 family protein [Candidatus Acidiferrales bacterium]
MASAETPSPVPAPAAPGSDSSFGRIFGVLFSPKPTFEAIVRRPTWILPLILIVVVAVGVIFTFSQRVGWRNFMIRQDQQNSRTQKQMESMTEEQRENLINTQTKVAPIFAYAAVIVGTFIAAVVVAAVLMLAFNLIHGTKIGFAPSLGIVSYSWVPGIIGGLLGILVLFLKDPSTVDLEHLVASNGGAFLADDSPKWMVTLFTAFDLFAFWNMILMAIGFSAADPKKISFGKALGTVVGVWLIYIIVKVGLVAAFS